MLRLAGWRTGHPGSAPVRAAQPTELLIGQAARALFDALPATQRRAVPELPDLIARLESAAERLRAREAELAEAIVACGFRPGQLRGSAERPAADQRSRAVEDLERARRDAGDRLATTVSALEGLRLDLLRLRAGVVKPEAITADLEAARKVSDDVDRLLEALAVVDGAVVRTPA